LCCILIGEVFIIFGFIGAFELAETTLKGIKDWWWKRAKPCLLTIAKFTIIITGILFSFLTEYTLWEDTISWTKNGPTNESTASD
jgi:hypothetical protein